MPQGSEAIRHEALFFFGGGPREGRFLYAIGSGSPGGSGISKTLSVMLTSM
jgi:hypothetical protein